MSCFSEQEIAIVVLEIIRRYPGIRTSELIAEARNQMNPNGEDLTLLDNRNDDKFSQKVRNIKGHNSIAHFVYTEGERNRRWYPI